MQACLVLITCSKVKLALAAQLVHKLVQAPVQVGLLLQVVA
jgi:hypothetical protein